MKIKIQHDTIQFGTHGLTVQFQRTLRIPDDGKRYPLPPSLGKFPVRRVDDYADRVPADWVEHGGVFVPMYQREAMWLSFGRKDHQPRAVKIAVGKVCALTGKRWSESLHKRKQDYLVTPPQPWLDGICAGKGSIRQFVAMPLGQGYTIEGQVTGEEVHGGLQIKVFEPKPGRFPRPRPVARRRMAPGAAGAPPAPAMACAPRSRAAAPARAPSAPMGLAAGGRMKQKIYRDPHGLDAWDDSNTARVFVHICNSVQWREITGEALPSTPVSAKSYAAHGLPWFDLYDEGESTLRPSGTLKNVKSVKQMDEQLHGISLQDDDSVETGAVTKLWNKLSKGFVRDGSW